MFLKKIYKIVKSEKNTINYLIEQGILSDDKKRWKSKTKFKLDLKRLRFRCPKKSCRTEKSMLEGTFFATLKVRLNKLLFMCYEYLKKTHMNMIKQSTKMGSEGLTEWTGHLRH